MGARSVNRNRYLDGKITHEEYYRALAKTAGVSFQNADPEFLDRVRKALGEGDKHLNSIPLAEWWDSQAYYFSPSVRAAFKEHGDLFSLAGGVCLAKQAARDAVL